MNWLPHKQLQKRWVSECGHYERTMFKGTAGTTFDAWFHCGQADFEHVGYSSDLEVLDCLVDAHVKRKQLASPTAANPEG